MISTPQGNDNLDITGGRTVMLSDPGNPLSVSSETDTEQVGGNSAATITYDAATSTIKDTSPEGRVSTLTLDAHDAIVGATDPGASASIDITRSPATGAIANSARAASQSPSAMTARAMSHRPPTPRARSTSTGGTPTIA